MGEYTLAKLNAEKKQKIVAQALAEIAFARQYKQGKVTNWKINENLYYSRKEVSDDARANVDLGKMSAFVHTILSKIDTPLTFKYTKRKEAQLERVKYLNRMREIDAQNDDWDIKDIAGKKQAVIYGRAIYSYFADSIKGYQAHLENIDVYDFLIDPSAGGIDIEKAGYLGNYGVVKTRKELEDGIKSKIYMKEDTELLLSGSGNATEEPQEEINKKNRTYDQNVYITNKELPNPDKFKFWRWGTTFEGERYYMLLSERGATAIEITPIKEKFSSELWWYWTWAAFPDLTEFWTPSFCDYVREIFMAQATSINQMLDNAEEINKPQKVVNVGAIENLGQLKYRRGGGYITIKKDFQASTSLVELRPPSINTPIAVFNLLEGIQEKASGVTAAAQGDAENNSGAKATIYAGNEENSADRFGFLNKSYSFGYKRFSKLYEWGVRDHLIKKTAVDILGPNGVEMFEVSRRDIFRKSETFGVMVESSNAELALSAKEKETKLAFLAGNSANPVQNPQKAYEISATIAGFDEDTIRQLQDRSDFGDAAIMAEAERDIERILDGERVEPNQAANTAYKQRFVDYMNDNQENIDMEQFTMLSDYVLLLDPIITRNMIRRANDILMKEMAATPLNPEDGRPGGDALSAKKPIANAV